MATRVVGIEIGGTKLQVVVGSPSGDVTERLRFDVDPARGASGIRDRLSAPLASLAGTGRIAGGAVGFGGPVDYRTGRVCVSHHVEGWSGFPLGEWIASLLKAPVRVENDANTAALAEARLGAGRGHDPVFYATLGSGVGGGLVVDGGIYHGAPPGEAELGHVRLDREGRTVESCCAGWAVDREVLAHVARDPSGLLARLVRESPGREARHLGPALAQGDPAARAILEATAADLAFGLSHVVHLFHPGRIVLGGGLALLGEPLRAAVSASLGSWVMEAFHPVPSVALAALREDAVPTGALLLAGTTTE
ncbi:MAG TPA: ROK family protein [Verrucomicrobiota bacterium]|nr:ROK family protein [Verrucomicrobiota bacterium]HNU50130.1 ROK family protein [Verrucomicrobiota bacterium]